jgi:PAS domain-containing protein
MSSLRVRSLAVVLAAIVPSLVFIVVHIARERRAETAEATQEMRALARAAALDAERSVEHAHQLLVVVASTHAVRRGDPLQCGALLSDLASRFPQYAYLAAVLIDGRTFCGAPRANTPAKLDVVKESYVTRALESRDFAVGDMVPHLSGRPASLPVAQAILDEKGAVTGTVLAGVSLEWLDRWASKVSLPPESTLALVDASGTVLARYPAALQQIGHPLQPTGLANAVLEGQQEGSKESENPAGEPYLYLFTHVGSRAHELHIVVGRPKAMVLAEANRDLVGELIALAFFAAAASAAGWVGTERLLLPLIRALITAAGRLGGGDLTSRTGLPHGQDEVGRLAAAYDGMAQALESRERLRSSAEAELTREKELLETILEHIPVMICFISRSGSIEWINHAFQRVLGWSLKEAGSRDILSILHAITVIAALLYLPFGKFFHIFQRPAQLGVKLYQDAGEAGEGAFCVRCGERFASRMHIDDLAAILPQLGFDYRLPGPAGHWQQICPGCKRKAIALAQIRLQEASRG